jgi:alpha,alpha-trehalase
LVKSLVKRTLCCSLLVCSGLLVAAASAQTPPPITTYIASSWSTLSRSMTECKSVVDPKLTATPILYLPFAMAVPPEIKAMQQQCHVDVRSLPRTIHHIDDVRPEELPAQGLLYLPQPYVVPGGRFNEMYGWDSYFIVLGLVHDKRIALAKGMVENFFFEIENYGALLNANRTYYFTRSQPPLLSSMIGEVYAQTHDAVWLARAYAYAERDHALWISPEHRAGDTGLARYHDLGEGPVPEMSDDSTYYTDVIGWLLAHPQVHAEYLVHGPAQATPAEAAALIKASCDPKLSPVCERAVVNGEHLSAAFYRGDRAMRESGYDTSFRFGPFSGSAENYAPVCLNSLLYKYELDMAGFADLLGKPRDAKRWRREASARKAAIDRYLWNAAAGRYFDYNYVTAQQSTYDFISTFYPLWAGVSSAAQAAAVRSHIALFAHPGGLAISTTVSGVQWDDPFGWAPAEWLAISGLAQHGFHGDAVRLAAAFSKTVQDNYLRDGTIREKYNVVDGSSDIKVSAGYHDNVIGFGWTNGVYLKLQDLLQQQQPAASH